MADVELVIKVPEECYKQIQKHIFSIAYDAIKTKEEKKQVEEKFNVVLAIKNGTPLPKDATNGDVFMTMFPNLIWHSTRSNLIGKTSVDMPIGDRWQKNMFYCDTDWWEAPYKESEE